MNLNEHNIELYNKYNILKHKEEFSIPLLVSTNPSYLNNLKLHKKVLYIGQETNTWMNTNDQTYEVEEIEQQYYEFLKKDCTKREFWRFLREVLDKQTIVDTTIWSNALIVSKKYDKGTPSNVEEIKKMSLENLLYLYDYFKPDITLITSGPCNPYYEIIYNFLKNIDSKLYGEYPDRNNLMVNDLDKNIFYTYHPNFLQRQNQLKKIATKVKKYTK